MRAFQRLETQLLAQWGHLFCWVPVCLEIGIGGYFALRFEPDVLVFLGLGLLLALGLILARIVRVAFAQLLVGLVLIGAGRGLQNTARRMSAVLCLDSGITGQSRGGLSILTGQAAMPCG